MSLYKTFQTNATLETSGVDLNYGKNSKDADIIIKVARAGGANKAYQKALVNKTRPIRRQIDTGTANDAVMEKIMLEVYAETVILDWQGVEGPDGKDIPFSVDNVKQVFTDLPDLFADVRTQAQEIAIFRADVLDDVVKN